MKTHKNYNAEMAVFKKKIKQLESYKGKHTELITLYIPHGTDRGTVMSQLTEEINQSSNIKSPTTRKNVQSALRKIIGFLKNINFKIPKNGLVLFSGNVSEVEGRNDIKLFTVRPPKELNTKLYWCDSEFHLDPLKEMLAPDEHYGLLTIDKNEATIAVLSGKHYDIVSHLNSTVPGKIRAGGQSAQRFERLREGALQDFFKRVSERFNKIFLDDLDKLNGIIIGGPGMTKNYFIDKEALHHELRKKVIGVLDTSYTDEGGIRELVNLSEDLLKDSELMKEKTLLDQFLAEISKDGSATYGYNEVEEAFEQGRIATLLVSEELPWIVIKKLCGHCDTKETELFRDPEKYDESKLKCNNCKSKVEVLEEVDYLDYAIEKAQETGAEIAVISTETNQGEQFYESFGGLGALLRY